MASPKLDLQDLAMERPKASSAPAPRRPRRSVVARYLLPAAVLLGFAGLLAAAAGERFLPRRSVRVVPVVVKRAEVQQSGTPLFQAAGWIEPRPTSINVAALTEGVVEELLVVEGEDVAAGQPIARLIDIDAKIALRRAKNDLALRIAEQSRAEATLEAARLRYENPAHLKALLADAKSALAQAETEIARLPYVIRAAEAQANYAQQNLAAKRGAGKGVAARMVDLAESERAQALADLEELRQRGPRLRKEADALRAKVAAVTRQHELLIEESRQLEEARAAVTIAAARVDEAELAIENAQLALDRTVVRAPVAGRVMKLVSPAGTRVMGLASSASQSSSTVVSMYDPETLQVRADVRLEDVPLVQSGQPVTIETASARQPISGHVLRATSAANIQKNTLEVKVALDDPPPWVRPEMLVSTTFLAPQRPESEENGSEESERLLVPRKLVQKQEGGAFVWIVTPGGRAARRAVTLGKAGTEKLIEVTQGLHPTDKLISSGRDGLEEGARLAIAGEDSSMGLET